VARGRLARHTFLLALALAQRWAAAGSCHGFGATRAADVSGGFARRC
jgi:hypothetical protein